MVDDAVTNRNHELLNPKVEPSSQRPPCQGQSGSGPDIIGLSSALRLVLRQVETVATTDSTVLILGETGTGKEVIARAIHNLSSRRHRNLGRADCASIPAGLLESELFGHEKGAFTGAIARNIGRFELADGGTLFLDEAGDIPLELQSKLLRVLQEQELERLGSTRTIHLDFRLVAATNRNLTELVESGRFRRDLYYRLNVFPIEMPPLRERKGDIPLLATAFLTKHADSMRPIETICQDFWRSVMSRDWAGNVRELENFVARCIALGSGPTLRDEDGCLIPEEIGNNTLAETDTHRLASIERYTIVKALKETKGDKIAAARILGIGKTTIYRSLDSTVRTLFSHCDSCGAGGASQTGKTFTPLASWGTWVRASSATSPFLFPFNAIGGFLRGAKGH